MNNKFGTLYLIPTLLGATDAEQVIPQGTLNIVRKIRFFVVENVRTARRMLSKMNMPCPIDELTFVELDKHDKSNNPDLMTYLGEALNGNDVGLMSEAGTPCVADPGSLIVELAHQAGIKVVPLTGPNAMILALMASGFNGQSFCFHGYLPIKSPERSAVFRQRPSGEVQNHDRRIGRGLQQPAYDRPVSQLCPVSGAAPSFRGCQRPSGEDRSEIRQRAGCV